MREKMCNKRLAQEWIERFVGGEWFHPLALAT
jgi:hypothetical protein